MVRQIAIYWTVQVSNSGECENFGTRPGRPWDPNQPPVQWVVGIYPGVKTTSAWC